MKKNVISIVLGFDFGTKRIGVAVGQTVTQSARPLACIQANEGVPNWENFDKLIKVWNPDALVVGIPLNMDGTEQALTLKAQNFLDTLKLRYQLPSFSMDERLSTKDARARLFEQGGYKALQKGKIDGVAAQLILQNWLYQQEHSKT